MESKVKTHDCGKDERAVTLTNDEWSTLQCYILMTTKYREHEAEAWEKLSTEKKDNGEPRFVHAESNAAFWREQEAVLAKIAKKIDPCN